MNALALHEEHQKRGATFTSLGGHELVARFGPVETELEAARAGTGVFDLSCRQVVRLTGPDRASFLHGMVTNDVEGLPERGTCYAALLTAKGAMVSDARILRGTDDLLLLVEPGLGDRVREFLGKFLISEDAELHDATAAFCLLSLTGPGSAALLAEACGEPVSLEEQRFQPLRLGGAAALALSSHLWGRPGADLLVAREGVQAAYSRLLQAGAVPVGFEAWEVLRVEAGVPRFGQDMGEATIPLEAGLERAISYQKGCYIGQEVIARATFRGHVNRKLAGLMLGDVLPKAGSELTREGKKVGWVTSAVRSPQVGQAIGLGYVHRDALEAGTRLSVEGGGEAVVKGLPFAL